VGFANVDRVGPLRRSSRPTRPTSSIGRRRSRGRMWQRHQFALRVRCARQPSWGRTIAL